MKKIVAIALIVYGSITSILMIIGQIDYELNYPKMHGWAETCFIIGFIMAVPVII